MLAHASSGGKAVGGRPGEGGRRVGEWVRMSGSESRRLGDVSDLRELMVNGERHRIDVPIDEVLSETLRRLGYNDVKIGCERGECGACSVLVGSDCVNSCALLTCLIDEPVTTPVGLAEETEDLRFELAQRGGFQCGFCTPGQVVAAAAFLRTCSAPASSDEVRQGLNGNLCRCTGYAAIVESVAAVANRRDAS